jgi:GntR family transcriptional regulator of arabinose operon
VIDYSTEEKLIKPFQSAQLLLQQEENRPTAFVCYNDDLAVKLLEVIRKSGLSVPDEVSIVGFDDSNLATVTEVKLTTLTHPKTEMGIAAAELLIGMIENKRGEASPEPIIYQPELIIRESTRKI